jgi:hypothetical protein
VGVGDFAAGHRSLAADLASLRHVSLLHGPRNGVGISTTRRRELQERDRGSGRNRLIFITRISMFRLPQ